MKKLYFTLLSIILLAGADALAKPYVVMASLDGFRWDYLGRGITPNLDSLAGAGSKALTLEPCFPSVTFPNHISIITGMYPQNHGIIDNYIVNKNNGSVYKLNDAAQVTNPDWYLGEAFWETARRNGIITASYFWPGSELTQESRRPNYYEKYEHTRSHPARVDGVLNWLRLPEDRRPQFITLYFDLVDTKGHEYGPDSPETNAAIARVDSAVGALARGISKLPFADEVSLIVLSDHGMARISKDSTIDVAPMLAGLGCRSAGYGPFLGIDCPDADEAFRRLKKGENRYKAYKTSEMPERFHYGANPFTPPILILADLNWMLVNGEKLREGYRGTHGFDNKSLDMHGIFIASGSAFKASYQVGSLRNIDVYPLLCEIFGIVPRSNIDGKAERIDFILKGK